MQIGVGEGGGLIRVLTPLSHRCSMAARCPVSSSVAAAPAAGASQCVADSSWASSVRCRAERGGVGWGHLVCRFCALATTVSASVGEGGGGFSGSREWAQCCRRTSLCMDVRSGTSVTTLAGTNSRLLAEVVSPAHDAGRTAESATSTPARADVTPGHTCTSEAPAYRWLAARRQRAFVVACNRLLVATGTGDTAFGCSLLCVAGTAHEYGRNALCCRFATSEGTCRRGGWDEDATFPTRPQ